MEHLWTPWRYHYISSDPPDDGCVFCTLRDDEPSRDEDNLILLRESSNYVLLNRFPYTSGHLLIVLNRHRDRLSSAAPEELSEMMLLARRSEEILREVYRPDGLNAGFNLGECAGAGVAGHLHMHLVPRWIGDSNLVGVLGQTRIIPERLEDTYGKLRHRFQNR